MDFLKNEFEGLPDSVVRAVLKQLERAIRSASLSVFDEVPHTDAQARRICARIAASIEFAQTFKKNLEDQSEIPPL